MTGELIPATICAMESRKSMKRPPLNLRKGLPGFSKAMAITDLVFSPVRALAGLIGVVAVVVLSSPESSVPMWVNGTESGSALLTGFFGITAGVLLLREKAAGVYWGWLAVFFAVLNMTSTVYLIMNYAPDGTATPTIAGILMGGSVPRLIRIGLLVAYSIGLKKASTWFAEVASEG